MADLTVNDDELHGAFEMFDKNNNGKIELQELKTVMQSLGQNPTDKDIKAMIEEHDLDKDGSINFDEFKKMMAKRLKSKDEIECELRNAFKTFDRDGNGFISASELQTVMTGLGEKMTDEEVSEMIRAADVNEDGFVDYQEFVVMFTQGFSGSRAS